VRRQNHQNTDSVSLEGNKKVVEVNKGRVSESASVTLKRIQLTLTGENARENSRI